mmetsp:Transcript_82406/g.176501  ORF Transcript_82406/g.176501 Transcript_82406/m.176501 type:complete len:335 (-) Transcript_82406:1020-2024(-)
MDNDGPKDLHAPSAVLEVPCEAPEIVEGLRCLGPQQGVLPGLGYLLRVVWRDLADMDMLRRQARVGGGPHLDARGHGTLRQGRPLGSVRIYICWRQREEGQSDRARQEATQVVHLPNGFPLRVDLDDLVRLPLTVWPRAHDRWQLSHHVQEELLERLLPAHQPLFQQVLVVGVHLSARGELRWHEARRRDPLGRAQKGRQEASGTRGLQRLEGGVRNLSEARVPCLIGQVPPLQLEAASLGHSDVLASSGADTPPEVPAGQWQPRGRVEGWQQPLRQLVRPLQEGGPSRERVRSEEAAQRTDSELEHGGGTILDPEPKRLLHELRRPVELLGQV